MSIDKVQRAFDRQTPTEDDWPSDDEVQMWLDGDGFQWANEQWAQSAAGLHAPSQGWDFVQWQENNWDKIVTEYTEQYEPPEPPHDTNAEKYDA